MKPALASLVLPLALAGCTIIPPSPEPLPPAAPAPVPMPDAAPPVETEPALTWIALGQSASVGGPQVRPISVAEDSRCPQGVQCVWAGRVAVQTRVTYANGTQNIERLFVTGEPVPVADGTLTLVSVRPAKTTEPIAPGDYLFGYRFDGGL